MTHHHHQLQLQKYLLYQSAVIGPGRMALPPLGDQTKMNGAYRYPALDARGVVCIAKAARITRDRSARPLNAPSLLLCRRWRSELGGPHYDGASAAA